MSNLNSTDKLTEFPSLERDERPDGRFSSLSKFLFWRKGDEPPPLSENGVVQLPPASGVGPIPAPPVMTSASPSSSTNVTSVGRKISVTIPPYRLDSNVSNPSPDSMDGPASPGSFEARNVSNVLRRLTNLIAMGSNNQSDLKKYWMPDSVSKECYECGEKFTTFRRKHHCRVCGQIFCSRCCNQEIPGKVIGYTGDLRVCVYCCKIVLSYLRSSDTNPDGTTDLRSVQEDLQNRFFGPNNSDFLQIGGGGGLQTPASEHSSSYRSLTRRKASACYQEERFAGTKEHSFDSFHTNDDKPKIVWDWVSLKSMWEEMLNPVTGIDWATHRHNMMKYCHSCVVGSELVDWLLAQRKITWRGQGVQIGQLLIDANLLECVSQAEQVFVDAYALYRPVQPVQTPLSSCLPEETTDSENISSRHSVDLEGEGLSRDSRDWGGQDPVWLKQISNPARKIEEGSEDDNSSTKNDVTSGSTTTSTSDSKSRLPSSSSYSLDLNFSSSTVSISKPKDAPTFDEVDVVSNVNTTTQSSSSLQSKNQTLQKNVSKIRNSSATTETMTDEFLQKTLQSQKDKGRDMVPTTGWHNPQQLTTDGELKAFQTLCNSYVNHENNLLNQLLDRMGVSPSWADVILPIVHKVTEIVRPDVRNAEDEMDLRQYIQFKKLPGGKKEDCRIVNGVVCTKNVVHNQMRKRLKDPNILLIGSSIDYQRFENRFLSLEPLVMQEHDYLKNTVARISAMKPDIVIVEKTVSRLAQKFMLELGITLVINVKPSIMERVGRLTQGVIWESADTPLGRPQLGLCHNFYLETFQLTGGKQKTLMFFDGCATHLGCTVLLRGGSHSELVKVKKIASFLIFVANNWRLERSFHIDSFSMPPEENKEDCLRSPSYSEFVDAKEDITGSPETTEVSKLVARTTESIKSNFENSLTQVILSASPFVKYPLPYLESEIGKACELRKYFPEVIYSTPQPAITTTDPTQILEDIDNNNMDDCFDSVMLNSKISTHKPRIHWEEAHLFTTSKLTSAIGSDEVQGLIADFRRKGSRLELEPGGNFLSSAEYNPSDTSSWNTVEQDKMKPGLGETQIDSLDPLKHQRLSVLFCSYSPVSANSPYFCVNPWVVNMDMYGRNDISLGMFLERYCFRKTYLCPARQCETPMIDHIRKFVHNNGCIEVILRELQSPILGSGQQILMWNWCANCRTVSPIVPMSVDGWSLSFAKYLELRFYGQAYTRRGFDNLCPHSLHQDHQHYFAQHSVVAAFKFAPIKLWEISLPLYQYPISVRKTPKNVPQLIDEVKSVAILGHGVYSNIFDVLTSLKENPSGLKVEEVLTALIEQQKAERAVFRSKIEDIQVNLATPACSDASEVDSHLWRVKDSIGFLKCNIAETIQQWNLSLNNFICQKKKEEKQAKDTTNTTAANTTTAKTLPRMESEPILPIVKDFEDSMGRLSCLDNLSVDLSEAVTSAHLEHSIHSNSDDRDAPNSEIGTTQLDIPTPNQKRSASPSPSTTSKIENDKTKSEAIKEYDESSEFPKIEKRSSSSTVKTLISHFMSGPGAQIIQTPWPALEHHFPAAYSNIPIPVYENEPSSIVAFTLGSTEYKSKLKQSGCSNLSCATGDDDMLSRRGKVLQTSTTSSGEFNATSNKSIPDEKGAGDTDEDRSAKKGDGNIEIQFSHSSAKFYCRVYFSENFRQLRKTCLVEGEELYVRSLARCVSWAASGGKSGSTFCKTSDDRFVIKQMSRFEIQSFLDFAPNYFDYMKSSLEERKPTVLVKIMGVYRIGFKNFQSNTASKMDILVMENLFYERTITQKFDLKGSIRNRLANVTGKEQEDLVLLDENLVNMACENPMYIRPHTKTVLSLALSNDSRFLASQLVMDYSLLVGLDDKNGTLVVGIIDYIRTFTWDKKIETFVKSSGILGGQGKTPTVVSPTEYQTRFCEAMDRYFLLVPDRWLGLGLGIDT
ncbi:1-phosphatidylinositol 3-phosphate 5-kinase isoform X2 [Folsomia candida]|uniref:1-phosphatidylinositol 3-phosphate 5-kinase isoform X2 n=1 Tax=Folsomia candida TaxID=158441 RepID=UPI001605254E|nr:1-phosphatidylinositol 3-phosphate 5-kinase isoform X2 [Folsomia candida]